LESSYFGDDDYYQQLLAAEDELAHRWVRGEMTGAQHEEFGKRLLASTAGREKAAFAETLTEVVGRLQAEMPANPAHTMWRRFWRTNAWMPVAAALALAVFGWQFIQLRQLRVQVGALGTQLQTERAPTPLTVSFLISPGLTRGSEQLQRLQIPADATAVRLQLPVNSSDQAKAYQAVLLTAAGRQIWGQTGLHGIASGGSQVVELILPAWLLTNDEYDLTLQNRRPDGDVEETASYHFGVRR
jgi:hypothetical protein